MKVHLGKVWFWDGITECCAIMTNGAKFAIPDDELEKMKLIVRKPVGRWFIFKYEPQDQFAYVVLEEEAAEALNKDMA